VAKITAIANKVPQNSLRSTVQYSKLLGEQFTVQQTQPTSSATSKTRNSGMRTAGRGDVLTGHGYRATRDAMTASLEQWRNGGKLHKLGETLAAVLHSPEEISPEVNETEPWPPR
jgi:NAD(P)H-hydrate repair Nnr-like enzyme with NAD(P)H-hydrate dehydratase domain